MEISRDEVRVMTGTGPRDWKRRWFFWSTPRHRGDTQRLKLIHLPRDNAPPHAPDVVVWAGKKPTIPQP